MALSKNDFEKLDSRLKNIIEQPVEQIEIHSDLPPTIEQLEDNNKTYSIVAAILFIDIRKSTYLTENSQAKSMVKIYRSFMRMAVDCVRKNGGVTRQFLGDRIMGVFIDSIDENGSVAEKAVDKAIDAARSLQTVIDYSLNKYLRSKVNGKIIECGIGIDYGKVLVTQVGMYGVEQDEDKENEVDCVWVGNTTNYASKYSDVASGGEIFISDNVFKQMSDEYKKVFIRSAKYKGTKLFQGYTTEDFYLDYFGELGKPIKTEGDSLVEIKTSQQLADGIKEVERLQNHLIQREREVAILEEKLKKENEKLLNQYNKEKKMRKQAQRERDHARIDYYMFLCELINSSFCQVGYVQQATEEFWNKIIEKCFKMGRILDYSEKQIKSEVAYGLIEIYSYYKRYEEAYDVIVVMAEINPILVNVKSEILKWAKENCVLYKLQYTIKRRLENGAVLWENRDSFENALKRLKR